MAKVFISYSRKDIEFAKRLTGELQKSDLGFWIDWEGIPPTVDWWEEIEKGIEEADAFVFLISADSANSKVCGQEIDHAVKNGKRLIPLVIRETKGDEVHPRLSPLNWIFFRKEDDFDASITKLLTSIHTDYDWVQTQRRLQVKALEWERNHKENSFLLRGKDLQDAELQVATNSSKEPFPTDLQREYVFESRNATDRQRRIVTGISIAGLIALAVLAIFGFYQAKLATDRANIALARQLAAQAQLLNNSNDLSLATLLAIQSVKIQPSSTAYQVLEKNVALPKFHLYYDNNNNNNMCCSNISFSPYGDYVVVTDPYSKNVNIWGFLNKTKTIIETHRADVGDITISPDGKNVAVSEDGIVSIWEIATGNIVTRFNVESTAHRNVARVAYDQAGKHIITSNSTETQVWDVETQKAILHIRYGYIPDIIALSKNGKYVITEDKHSVGTVWDTASGAEIANLPSDVWGFFYIFSPDENYVALGSAAGIVYVWEIKSGKKILQINHSDLISSIAFSEDGRFVASGSHDNTIQVWELKTGKKVSNIVHSSGVINVTFSPDSNYIAAGGVGNITDAVMIWNVLTGIEIAQTTYENISSVSFSFDGEYIAVGSQSGLDIFIWKPDDLISVACSNLSRNLYPWEWEQYIGNTMPYQKVCPTLPLPIDAVPTSRT